ncbi:MAG: helix-turn-helix transcriptional regulator, partial [Oscillibacter sp.]
MTLGEKIAKFRTEQHLSQGDLAEKMGVSRQSVSKWETGSSVPDLDKLVTLSELFSVSLDALVKEQAPTETPPTVSPAPPPVFPPRKIAGWILLAVGLLC